MKKFIRNIPRQISCTFSIMIITFTIISGLSGIEIIPLCRLIELFMLSIMGGIWMEFSFGSCIIKKMPDAKRVFIFIVPFAVITFICAVIFKWITELKSISTYIRFIGIFFVCWVISIILFEVEHAIKGKQYTKKLREYQNGGSKND